MYKPTVRTDCSILRFTPERAIKIAYQVYRADHTKPGSHLQTAASTVVNMVLAEISAFAGDDLASQYLADWLAEVTDCAGTIASRKVARDDAILALKKGHDDHVASIGRNLIVGGLASGAWKIIVLGVGLYAFLSRIFVHYHLIALEHGEGTQHFDPRVSAGAIAVGTALLLAAWRAYALPRRVMRLAQELSADLDKVHKRYRMEARAEYTKCGQAVALLWKDMHGTEAPGTDCIELIIDVSGDESLEDEVPPPAAAPSRWRRWCFWLRPAESQ
ncbi:MAG: hypothetical protein JSS83_14890 [Cyanobacteria bacterium SZAS LIN-3]|nr:hypothetical protein [Cyanobacteria bacterium SZAS LIN-3]